MSPRHSVGNARDCSMHRLGTAVKKWARFFTTEEHTDGEEVMAHDDRVPSELQFELLKWIRNVHAR